MQLRNLGVLVGFIGLFYSSLTLALGLGEISLKSSYNEPLRAEIRLLQVRDLSKEEILVALASREDFKRVGLDRLFFLTDLKYEVVLNNPSYPHIKVSSKKPVQEPYLNFLLDVQWPSGRLLREYTLLLDLPVFSQNKSVAPVATPRAATPNQTPKPVVRSTPSRINTPAPAPRATSSVNVSSTPPDSYRVKSGDTMWEIARKLRPDSSVTVSQTMIAIQALNPDAFINGNINLLRKGQVLRTPTAEEIQSTRYQDAVSSIKQQNQVWSKKSQRAALSAVSPTSGARAATKQEGRLTLGAANSSDTSTAVKGSGASGSGESLQNELAIAQEELDKAGRENSDLKSRVKELEEQIKTMESLVKLTNDQLKALELATAQKDNESEQETPVAEGVVDLAKEETDAASEPSTESAQDVAPVCESAALTESTGETTTTAPEEPVIDVTPEPAVVVEEPKEAVVTPEPVTPEVVAPKADRGIVGFIMDNILAFAGGLIALLIAIFAIKRLKSKDEDEDFNEFDFDSEMSEFDSELEPEVASFDEDLESVDLDELEEQQELSVEAKTEDPVAEADIFISLGQPDKAEALLQAEINQNPGNAAARLALLKIYSKAQNATAFDDQYAQLLPLGDVDANHQAKSLRDNISNITDFDVETYSIDEAVPAEQADELDLDLDLDFDSDDDFLNEALAEGGDSINELTAELTDDVNNLSAELDDLPLDLDEEDQFQIDETDSSLNDDLMALDDDLSDDLDLGLDVESTDNDQAIDDLDDDFIADLDLDGDTETDLSLDGDLSLDDDLIEDLDLDLDSELTDDLDVDLTLDSESVADISDDLTDDLENKVEDELSADLTLESGEDNLDAELGLEGELADDLDLELDLDADSSAELSALVPDVSDTVIKESKEFDLDLPPGDIDIESLDQEIDAMTSALDTDLDFDDSIVEDITEGSLGGDITESVSDLVSNDLPDVDTSSDQASEENLVLDDEISELSNDEALSEAKDELSYSLGESTANPGEVLIDGSEQVDDLDFLDDNDEVTTKLDLARAYIDMGDNEGAEDILQEVIEEGSSEQKRDAEALLKTL